jgi:cell division protein FtsI/penicillin-binding protein 2
LDSEIAQIVADAMRQTITAGSARMLQSLSVPVAGKTGTAQWSSTFAPHSWFTGFGPIDDPEIVITVLVEQGGKDNYAIPLARDIFDWYFSNAD